MGREVSKQALKEAKRITEEFLDRFENALSPKSATKLEYLEALEELAADVDARIECVKDELAE